VLNLVGTTLLNFTNDDAVGELFDFFLCGIFCELLISPVYLSTDEGQVPNVSKPSHLQIANCSQIIAGSNRESTSRCVFTVWNSRAVPHSRFQIERLQNFCSLGFRR
jgi:hypothetical protein